MSGIFFNEQNTLSQFTQADKAKGFRTTFSENYEAAKADFYSRYRSDSKALGFAEVFNEQYNMFNWLSENQEFPNPLHLTHPDTKPMPELEQEVRDYNDNLILSGDVDQIHAGYRTLYEEHLNWYFNKVDELKAQQPIKYADLMSRDQVDQEVIDRARNAWTENKQVMANAEPGLFGWNWGQIAAGARAGITDPLVLTTLPIGVATTGFTLSGVVAMQFLKTFAVEAVLGIASETAIQFGVYNYNNSELGIEHTKKQALITIFTVGAASGVLSSVLLGLFKSGAIPFAKYQQYKIAKDPEAWLKKNLTSIIDDATKLRPETKDLILDALAEMPREDLLKFVKGLPNEMKTKDLYRFIDMEENKKIELKRNPFEKNTENNLKFQNDLEEAKHNLINDTIPTEEKPTITLDEGTKEYSDGFVEFRIDELEVDAKLFQYKEGGDEFGVTDRLKDVTEWNPHASNAIMVYEFANGRKVIADGHQRLGLAKRILAQKDGQKPKLVGMLSREVDGYSPDQIKVWAAIKNIQEGSGTSVDAAKILRISKKNFDDFKASLPPRSNLVKEAMAMEGLADDAFDLVVRGQFPPAHAAMVARLVKDKSMHKTILQLLKQTDPNNLSKARSIILQAMDSGTQVIEQTDLLGTEFITRSLFTNKADILDAVIRGLRADKNLFKRLNLQKNKINSSGKNVLDESYNKNRESINEKILQFIEKQATRSGNKLAEDLNIAAKLHADGNESAAIRQFEEAIDRANARGDFDGYDVGGSGSAEKSPIQDNRISEKEDLSTAKPQEDFSDIGGTGQRDQGDHLVDQLNEVIEKHNKAERGEFGVDGEEVLQNSSPIDRAVLKPILDKIDPEIIVEALATINKARAKNKLPPFKNLDDAIDQYEKDQLAISRMETTEAIIDSDARVKIQNKILKTLKENNGHSNKKDKLFTGKPKEEKLIVFVMGKPGSGKSVIEATPLIKKLKAVLIDVDEAKKLFPEYDNGKGSGVIHEESAKVIKGLLKDAMRKGQNVVFPVVGANFDTLLSKIKTFKDLGYKVKLHNIDIPGDESYRRAFVRYLKTGRLLPHEFLLSIGDKPNIVYNQLKKIGVLDGYKKTDNFVKRGEKPILIENEGGVSIGETISKRSRTSGSGDIRGTETSRRSAEDTKRLEEINNQTEILIKEYKSLTKLPVIKQIFGKTSKRIESIEKEIENLKTEYNNILSKKETTDVASLSDDQKLLDEFMDEEFSVSSRVEEDEIMADMITAKQAMEDINNDQAIINRLRDCV